MKGHRYQLLIVLLAGVIFLPPQRPAQALVVTPELPPLAIVALARQADLIIVGRSQTVASAMTTSLFGDELIVSDVTIAIEETLKGTASRTIQLPDQVGGVIHDIGMASSDSPLFVQGQLSLLFFEERPDGVRVLAGAAGKLDIDSNGQLIALGLPLAEVKALIRAALSQYRVYLPLMMSGGASLAAARNIPTHTTNVEPQFLLTGKRWFGDSPNIQFLINNPGFNDSAAGTIPQQNQAILAATASWGRQGRANISASISGTTTISTVRADAQNLIIVRNATNPIDANTLATALYMWRADTAALVGCDIVFWDRPHVFSPLGSPGTIDIQSVTTHELGHCLGLDHSTVPGTTMFPSVDPGETHMRTLHTDDMNGIRAIYQPRLVPFDESPADTFEVGDRFGEAVVMNNFYPDDFLLDDLAVGASGENVETGAEAGAVFLYANGGTTFSPPVRLTQAGAGLDEPGDHFGAALAAGDFNHDSFIDLVVGAPGEDFAGSGPDAGMVFLFLGTHDGVGTPQLIQQSPADMHEAGDHFGAALLAGDFNGDSYDDLAVGAPGEAYGAGTDNAGAVYVYLGNASGLGGPRQLTQAGAGIDEAGDRFGTALTAGDFNGDGFDDLAAGAPGEDFNASGAGAGVIFVFPGGATGLGAPRVFDQAPAGRNESGDHFGTALAAGDFNGDGVDDLAVSAPDEDYGGSRAQAGVVFTFAGSAVGLGQPAVFGQELADLNEAGDLFGATIAAADFNLDGFAELAIGAPGEDFDGSGAGGGVVFIRQFNDDSDGTNDFMLVLSQQPIHVSHTGDHFGQTLAVSPNAHHLAIGTPGRYQSIIPRVGAVFVWK